MHKIEFLAWTLLVNTERTERFYSERGEECVFGGFDLEIQPDAEQRIIKAVCEKFFIDPKYIANATAYMQLEENVVFGVLEYLFSGKILEGRDVRRATLEHTIQLESGDQTICLDEFCEVDPVLVGFSRSRLNKAQLNEAVSILFYCKYCWGSTN